ncbi:hypothetical protein CFOL_v3_25305 [Cephalotus follicularis]|uniref:Uncharacterized protein n=1 Tax=Cephalotus follicularis TaxID=3775 RepID=A0A1Q3CP00_CEPFO|nr:hypothetical protein CFOL_v3_25305 [Cephalotus follicularis]
MVALLELFMSLRTKKRILTPLEASVVQASKDKAFKQFNVGFFLGGALTWAATWKLNKQLRTSLAGTTALYYGRHRCRRSFNQSVDDVLALEGTQMQMELANVIVNNYWDDPWHMQVLAKHFYMERIYDDTTSDQPNLRWRFRNYFSDNVGYGQRRPNNDYYVDLHKDSPDSSRTVPNNDSDGKKADLDSKQVPVSAVVDAMPDALDEVFGYMAMAEEIHRPTTSSMPPKVLTRHHKRSHRRRRLRHHEVSSEPEQV